MLNIQYFFSRKNLIGNVGYELGYFKIFDNDKIIYDGQQKQNFMLFLSIPDILLDLCELIESKKQNKETILADSSITICFLNNNDEIEIRINNNFILRKEKKEVIKAIYESSKKFIEENINRIEDSVKSDLNYGLERYKLVMTKNNLL